MWLERLAEERNMVKIEGSSKGKKGRKVAAFKKKKRLIEGLTIARSLFRLRKTLCLLMDLRLAMSSG